MKRVTINDVAKAAGVSRQTVSRAMNDKREISPETKERVMIAVEQLGYQPNRLAQGMVTRRTRSVGLILADITNPFFPEVARGVQDTARDNDYNVLLCNSDEDPKVEVATLYSLAAQGVDGIILFAHKASDEDLLGFADNYSPILIVNRVLEHPNIVQLMVDNLHGSRLAVAHLVGKGHVHIGMLANAFNNPDLIRRVQGYKAVLREHGMPLREEWIAQAAPTLQGGYECARRLLTEFGEITAVFTYNDLMAIGALRACQDMGRRVPEDVEIIGFDDILMASMVTPALSSVRVDKYQLGQMAITRLLDMIDHPEEHFSSIHMDVELVLRESTS